MFGRPAQSLPPLEPQSHVIPRSTVKRSRWSAALVSAVVLAASGCRTAPAAPPPTPLNPGREALAAEGINRIQGPVRVVFAWTAQELGGRLSGEGVVRMEPPYRARLDLFAANGEGVARAALVSDDLRLPREAMGITLPPPALFWAALGVFRPGPGTALLGASHEGSGTLLRYGYADETRLHYTLEGRRIRRVELIRNGSVEEEVLLTWGDTESRAPERSRYRLMRETRELNLELELVEDVEAYPPDTWIPGG